MDERLSGGRLNAYLPTHRRRMSNPCEATLGCRYSGESLSEFEGRRTSTRPSDTPVIQIPIQSRPSCLHQGLRILVLSRFRYRVDPSCLHKAFGYSCLSRFRYRVDHLEEPETIECTRKMFVEDIASVKKKCYV
jgi:hypothetical protein